MATRAPDGANKIEDLAINTDMTASFHNLCYVLSTALCVLLSRPAKDKVPGRVTRGCKPVSKSECKVGKEWLDVRW